LGLRRGWKKATYLRQLGTPHENSLSDPVSGSPPGKVPSTVAELCSFQRHRRTIEALVPDVGGAS
jgi:hypothetical protein